MEILGLGVAALVAVIGWLVSGVLARRALRRQSRVEYLLSAYRALDAASNRELTRDVVRSMEQAVSDIQLLGTRSQIQGADTFSRAFAVQGEASLNVLLGALRSDLRRELQLESVPERQTWLVVSGDARWAAERREVWARLRVASSALGEAPPKSPTGELRPPQAFQAIDDAYKQVADALTWKFEDVAATVPPDSHPDVIIEGALQEADLSAANRQALTGLQIMHGLASTDARRGELSEEKIDDFRQLAKAISFAVRHQTSSNEE